MDRTLALTQLKAFGLKVAKGVVVDKNDYKYGVVTNYSLRSIDDEDFEIDDIDHFSYVAVNRELIVVGKDESSFTIRGRTMDYESHEVLEIRQMPKTILELDNVFTMLYPDAVSQFYFDELMEREMIDMAALGYPEEGCVPIDDGIMSLLYKDVEDKLCQNGFVGRPPSQDVINNVLNIQIRNHRRNHFREWVESHDWDGRPRIRTWFQRLFGATAPALEVSGTDQKYIGDVAEAWFIGGIRRMFVETKHEIVPVFISDQGIGKGLALKFTAGEDRWYCDTSVNVKEPDKFLDSVRGCVIVELSEASQIRSADSELLKAFISKSSDQMRKAYGRYSARYPRHFIIAASSNLDTIFTDITGNRRFFPMYCNPEKATMEFSQDRSQGQYEVEQVWAEALQLYRDGHKWYISEDSAALANVMQEFGAIENSNIELIDDWLDDPNNGYDEIGARISKKTIMTELFNLSALQIIPKDAEIAYRAWTNGTKSWRKINRTVRINGKTERGYERVIAPGGTKVIKRLKIVDRAPKKIETVSLDELMRLRSVVYGYANVGDLFPTNGLSDETVDELLDNGYIYELRKDGERTLRVGYLPGPGKEGSE